MLVTHLVPALFDAHTGILGGAERYALELARHMADVLPTRLVTFGPVDRIEHLGRLTIRVVGRPWYVRGQRTNPFSFRILDDIRIADVIHCHQRYVVASTFTAILGRLLRRRVFVSDLGGRGWDISSYCSTDRWFHGHLHISEYSRKVFGQDGFSRTRVIYGGIDIERFRPDFDIAREHTVLFVGRLLPHKGVNYLIEAVPPDLRLEVIGQPYDRDYYGLLKQLAGNKQVTFRHDCDDTELIRSYQKAMCVVLPSVYKSVYGRETKIPELLGQTLLEGMACGLPAICTNVASMPEIVVDGVTGFVVPPNDPAALRERLIWLRDHPQEARKMGEAGRQRVLERFTWPAVVQRCLAAYRELAP